MKNKKQSLIRTICISCLLVLALVTIFAKQISHASWVEEMDGIKYQQEDGQYAVGFMDIEDKRYFFDQDGYLVKGKFYVTDEDAYYYSDQDGILQYGVIKTEDEFYITAEDGKLKTGFVDHEGVRYYFNEYAQLVTGWFKYDKNWYYADTSGIIMTGFVTIDGYRYYLNNDGTRVKDAILEIDGVTYIFNKDGSIDENATTLYPVFTFLNQLRVKNGAAELLLNTKVQACAILRASELVNGFHIGVEDSLERLLNNRGVKSSGGYEFSYGGISDYGIDRLIQDMGKDSNLLSVIQDDSLKEVGLGVYTIDNISYYDIIFVEGSMD